jgi:hypothetical protein
MNGPTNRVFILVGMFAIVFTIAVAIDTLSTGFKVDSLAEASIDAHGTCKKVTNSGTNAIFVPTRTAAEWASFLANLPAGTSVADCAPPCAGLKESYFSPTSSTSIVVPAGCTQATVKLWGAGGAHDGFGSNGGGGGYTAGMLDVVQGETLTIIVGQGGNWFSGAATIGGGGSALGAGDYAGPGGGRSAIRRTGVELVTAGGGGGASTGNYGGAGGGLVGQRGGGPGSYGGTQSAGGCAFPAGTGPCGTAFQGAGVPAACGGGGGYYGGGGGDFNGCGGGSGYVGGAVGATTTAGSGRFPPNTPGTGLGGSATGGNGLVVISYS